MFSTTKRVAQLAEERGMSVTQFAVECGLNRSTFCATLRRGGQLKIDTIETICDSLHMTLGEFFTLPKDVEKVH